jgi:cyclopropane-fatty-acyl-phospholipid synthase
MLGPRLKYSCCIWPADELGNKPGASEAELEFRLLDLAEEEMLKLYAKRADMKDGMNILELGCGWGSFCLWAAENYPESRIWAVSNSTGQGEFIRQKAKEKDLLNLTVLTEDMNEFSPPKEAGAFDRIVSIEMFEHMRNWQALLKRISNWLAPEGLFFLHIFVHRDLAYLFQEGPDQWMARHFFTGGMMPSANLLLYLQKDLEILDHWLVSGLHYARTLESWLALLDANQKACREVLRNDPNPESAKTLFNRWRIFLIACSELFGFDSGNQWLVAHYLMKNRRP